MATLPIINGIFRVALNWRVGANGPTAANVMHFFSTTGPASALWSALDTNVTAQMWVGVVATAAVYQVNITPLDGTTATSIFTPAGTKWAGSGGTGDYSPASAVVVSLRTAQRGRQNRGRLYIPFLTETVMSSGSLLPPFTGNQAAWDTFRGAMTTAAFPMHVASYGHSLHRSKTPGGGYVLTPVTWTPHSNLVTATTVEGTLATMRPRQSRLR